MKENDLVERLDGRGKGWRYEVETVETRNGREMAFCIPFRKPGGPITMSTAARECFWSPVEKLRIAGKATTSESGWLDDINKRKEQ